MKERIVIEKEVLERLIKALPVQWFDNEGEKKIVLFGKEYQVEKEPSNWKELVELCKSLKTDKIEIKDEHCIYVSTEHYGYLGNIVAFTNYDYYLISVVTKEYYDGQDRLDEFACDVEPKEMYQIIKSLIGEEE